MDNRIIAALAVSAVGVLAACSSPQPALGNRTAEVTVNGAGNGTKYPVECSQAGWTWMISTFDEAKPGFSAAIQTGDSVAAHSVQIRDLEGFTGSYWQGTVGDGKATVDGAKITITGTAEGSFADNPTGEANATYRIETSC
ncbi:lipoprotein LpqH [Mycolicibacterium sp. S2-37]|uniref:lipoprotein LpqH n=1 Tax=Mycolicibacterium sp. S2-37 TaxID=2810297 RepID=UPI001A94ED1E|nr:lipoprotein LpqH [Mycolicibacterium sp. S2-37]MBO0676072.1 lipoprotein LpqH [Mycolicibacterium sp. S2-37]